MRRGEIREALEAEVLCGESQVERGIETACASDLTSDVLAFACPRSLLTSGASRLLRASRQPIQEGWDMVSDPGMEVT